MKRSSWTNWTKIKIKMKQGFVKSYDGTRIHYEVMGKGFPLIFCYGIVCSAQQWKFQTKYFRKKYKIIHFDYRGHNQSESPRHPERITIEGCARDLNAVMGELDIKKAVLIGHSIGVNVIFQFAALYPKKVSGLVAICGTVFNPLKTMFHSDIAIAGFELLKLAYIRFPKQFPKIWKKTIPSPVSNILTSLLGFNPQLTRQKEVKTYLSGVARQPTQTFFYLLQDMSRFDGDEILKKVKAPTLIVGGTRDFIIPIRNQYAIYRKIKKNAVFLRVQGGSHCSHIDMPELVNLGIEKFINQLQAA